MFKFGANNCLEYFFLLIFIMFNWTGFDEMKSLYETTEETTISQCSVSLISFCVRFVVDKTKSKALKMKRVFNPV